MNLNSFLNYFLKNKIFIFERYEGVLVALGNEINLYIDQLRVDTIRMDRPIEWIKFGRMGREEGVLVISTEGNLLILVKRHKFLIVFRGRK